MKALIVEDEIMARTQLARVLSTEFPDIEVVAMTDSVSSTVAYLKGNSEPDVIFMDVELLDGDCFEIFRQTEVHSKVIMTTAYDSYAIKAFEVGGIDYLLKPIGLSALKRAVNRAAEMLSRENAGPKYTEYSTVRIGDRIIPVTAKEIAFFYSEDKANYLMTFKGEKYMVESTLEQLEGQLNPVDFFRISRGAIVSRNAITEASRHLSGRLLLKTQPRPSFELTVSRARVEEFFNWLEIQK